MKILFAGTPEVAAETLRVIHTDARFAMHEVVGVLTREDAPLGRKRILTPSAVARTAAELGIPTIKANRISAETLVEIEELGADAGIVVAYGVLFRKDALDALPKGWFNLHFSTLPKLRGAAPVQRSILDDPSAAGVTLFRLDEGMDTGPIVDQVQLEIQPAETAGELLTRARIIGESILAQALPALAAGIVRLTAQPDEGSRAAKITREVAHVLPSQSVELCDRRIRACNPEPIAFVELTSGPLRILRARPAESTIELPVGTIAMTERRVVLQCHDGLLELLELQPAGKNPMPSADWARGIRLPVDTVTNLEN